MNQKDSSHEVNDKSEGRGRSRGKRGAEGPRESNQSQNGDAKGSRGSSRKRTGGGHGGQIAAAAVIVVLAAGALYITKPYWTGILGGKSAADVNLSGGGEQREISLDGHQFLVPQSREEAKASVSLLYPWKMQVTFEGDTCDVEDPIAPRIDALVSEIYDQQPKTSYSLDVSGLEEFAAGQAEEIAARWERPAMSGVPTSYDAASDTFLFDGGQNGVEIDEEKLETDIRRALEEKRFDAVIEASGAEVLPGADDGDSQKLYKTIATYTTETTANAARNTNIDLASKALNGTIVKSGEEFSFNETVGQRTAKKGYKGAAAYNNGEVVQEIGGGVCQLSTTLYNATVIAGLEITKRQSHTFEPSYITPGQDATVSWGAPDYKFRNNSKTPIGIRAFYSDRKVTVSIYGIPILEEGVEYSLKSKKLATIGVPAPKYEEDPTLPPGTEVVRKGGSNGSRWETRLVITKNGEVISDEVDHTATYVGHAPVIARNSTPAPPETTVEEPSTEATESPTESPAKELGPGAVLPQNTPDENSGPGGSNTPGTADPGSAGGQSTIPGNPSGAGPDSVGGGQTSGGPGGADASGTTSNGPTTIVAPPGSPQ